MKLDIGIHPNNTRSVVQILSSLLADEYILYTKTRNAHWNVDGPDFYAMHKFFEAQYETIDATIDDVAERIRSLGHFAPATLKEFIELTHLTEKPRTKNDRISFMYIKELLGDHESIINSLRDAILKVGNDYKDLGTSDFMTSLMEQHEKMAWMLRMHLN